MTQLGFIPTDLANQSFVLPVHKPSGPTSRQVVDEVETRFEDVKVGHGGTLDPLAEGLLPLHFNEATKVVDYLHDQPKTYRIRCRFDLQSPSIDLGEQPDPVPTTDPPPRKTVQEKLETFVGVVEQVPPRYSAIKVDGEPLYEQVRNGSLEQKPDARKVHCKSIELLTYDYPSLTLRITCGKGFYVRSLVRDLAGSLSQNGGVVTVLVRMSYGSYDLAETAKLYEDTEQWGASAHPLESALRSVPYRRCTREELNRVVHGGRLPRREINADRSAAVGPEGRAHALLEPDPEDPAKIWKPKRVLNRPRP